MKSQKTIFRRDRKCQRTRTTTRTKTRTRTTTRTTRIRTRITTRTETTSACCLKKPACTNRPALESRYIEKEKQDFQTGASGDFKNCQSKSDGIGLY